MPDCVSSEINDSMKNPSGGEENLYLSLHLGHDSNVAVVDGAGNVTQATNKGLYFAPAADPDSTYTIYLPLIANHDTSNHYSAP